MPGRGRLGRWSRPIGIVATIWVVFIFILFMLPQAFPITIATFNYTPVVFLVVLGGAAIWYFVSAKNWFKGPKVQGSARGAGRDRARPRGHLTVRPAGALTPATGRVEPVGLLAGGLVVRAVGDDGSVEHRRPGRERRTRTPSAGAAASGRSSTTSASRVTVAADRLDEAEDDPGVAIDRDRDVEVGSVAGQLGRPRVVALEQDRLAPGRRRRCRSTGSGPVASTFWQ